MNTFKTWPKFPGTHSRNKPPDTYLVFLGEEALHLEQQGVQALDLENAKKVAKCKLIPLGSFVSSASVILSTISKCFCQL